MECLHNRNGGVLRGSIDGKRIDGVDNGEIPIDRHEDQEINAHESREMIDELS